MPCWAGRSRALTGCRSASRLFNKNVLGQFRLWNHYTAAGRGPRASPSGASWSSRSARSTFPVGPVPGAHIPLVGGTTWFMFVQDIAQVFVLVAIVTFFYRRYVTQPERLSRDPQGPIILGPDRRADGHALPRRARPTSWPGSSRTTGRSGPSRPRWRRASRRSGATATSGAIVVLHDAAWWLHVGHHPGLPGLSRLLQAPAPLHLAAQRLLLRSDAEGRAAAGQGHRAAHRERGAVGRQPRRRTWAARTSSTSTPAPSAAAARTPARPGRPTSRSRPRS